MSEGPDPPPVGCVTLAGRLHAQGLLRAIQCPLGDSIALGVPLYVGSRGRPAREPVGEPVARFLERAAGPAPRTLRRQGVIGRHLHPAILPSDHWPAVT